MIGGFYPFLRRLKVGITGGNFAIGESLAAGVFLGAGLMHMLGDSSQQFYTLHYDYPISFLIAGSTFLFFLLLEHIGTELSLHKKSNTHFAILATVMLSIHSFFTGAALGIANSDALVVVILLAVLAHKWVASFALAVEINKSDLSFKVGIILFLLFASMLPLGIILGSFITGPMGHHPILEPIFTAIAAGTFLYLGTLHGLEKATLIKQCCNLSKYYYVILGFSIMAIVAIWT